jgi:ABC-type antimicrobial peptide transport system permease subunit
MLGLLGTIGFVLAAVGLHGLIGQTVVERRRPGRRPGARVVQWTPRRESAVRGDEPRSVAVRLAALLMIAVVCLASISPAIAATRVDPLEVLKSE